MRGALNRKTRCESEPCTRPLEVELGAKSGRDTVSGIARSAETSSQHTKEHGGEASHTVAGRNNKKVDIVDIRPAATKNWENQSIRRSSI